MIDRTRGLKDVLWFLIFGGAVALVFRLWFGLGATTNLSDAVPWGLWKIFNMVAGVALATSGFTIGFLVYVLRIETLRPLVKPAILVAFLGYGSSVFALFLDIGLPHRIWHPIVMWNERSFLFEVAWCVMLYFTVTFIELSPTFLEKFRLRRLANFLHRIAYGVVVIGIALSCLHHSSLGSLFLVTPGRLHPLWFTPRLPLLFILSAAAAGLMVAMLAKLVYAYLYDPFSVFGDRSLQKSSLCITLPKSASSGPGWDFPMLQRLASIAAWVLSSYLVLKVADLIAVGAFPYLLTPTWESFFYLGDLITFAVIPLLLILHPRTRRSPAGLAAASISTVIGLIWNRLNVGIFGYFHDAGTVYFPSLTEWALSLGILAAAAMAFLFLSENLPIFDDAWQIRRRQQVRFLPSFDRLSGVWFQALAGGLHRTSLIAVLAIPLAWVLLYPPFAADPESTADSVAPPLAMDAERQVLELDGNRQYLAVKFPHGEHQTLLGGDQSCVSCHHLSLPRDHSTPCSRCHRSMRSDTNIFDHSSHFIWVAEQKELGGLIPANNSCRICHLSTGPEHRDTAIACLECHRNDMKPEHDIEEPIDMEWACGYQAALHETCMGCHSPECSTCHLQQSPNIDIAQDLANRR